MKQSWFTSDTHFGHAKVIQHSQRPFASVEEMDKQLIYNWNCNVAPGDDVYHLGDFAWRGDAGVYYAALNGNIHKIKGNHHSAAHKIAEKFIWVKDVHEIKIRYEKEPFGVCDCGLVREGLVGVGFKHHHQCASLKPVMGKQYIFLSHYSHRVWPRMHHGVWHLYGHSHGNLADLGDLSMDVGVDAVAKLLTKMRFAEMMQQPRTGEHLLWDWVPKKEDYRPISFTEIQAIMKHRNFEARDHHSGSEVGS